MAYDQAYKIALKQSLNNLKNKKGTYSALVKQLAKCNECYGWKILDETSKQLVKQNKFFVKQIVNEILKNIEQVKTLTMLLYIYQYMKKNSNNDIKSNQWMKLYEKICNQNHANLIFSTWILHQTYSEIVQNSLEIVIQVFPKFCKDEILFLTQSRLNECIKWICYYYCPQVDSPKYQVYGKNLKSFVGFIKEIQTTLTADFAQKQHMVIKKLLEMCREGDKISQNAVQFYWRFNPSRNSINCFFHIFSNFILDLQEETIVYFFVNVSRKGINQEIVHFISKITVLLASQEQYYKLEIIYQQFILPYLARRGKLRKNLQAEIYQVCQFYVRGFLKYCSFDEKSMECLTKNISKVSNAAVHKKWIELCRLVCYECPNLKDETQMILKQQMRKNMQYKQLSVQQYKSIVNNPQYILEIRGQNMKKLRKYERFESQLKGIKNDQNECYIIVVIQSLFHGKQLHRLLKQLKQKTKINQLLQQILLLFNQLSNRNQNHSIISIKKLKSIGPIAFRQTYQQQDVYQYLIQLFSCIQDQLQKINNNHFINTFKNIYQIQSDRTRKCLKCGNQATETQKSYALTIPNSNTLQETTQQIIDDFKCSECSEKQFAFITKLKPKSSILIVHINRFSNVDNNIVKEMSTQDIRRKFLGYTLVGIISHRGKNVQHGHYVYYHRINAKRWALMNDLATEEFDLWTDDEKFEKEWRVDMTPYILFYQRLERD